MNILPYEYTLAWSPRWSGQSHTQAQNLANALGDRP